jgi:hypothetical protein
MADVTRKGLLQPIDVHGLLAAREAGILTSSMPTGEMSAVEPSMRDQIAQWLATMISDDENRQRYVAQKAGGAMDLVPGLGAAVGGDEAGRDIGAGNYLSGGLGLAMSAIPGAKAAKKGIKAFHASPHDFDAFDMSKIGTGEGTQMEGRGLYFGQAPDVADFYQESTVKDLMARKANDAQPMHPDQRRRMVDDIVKIIEDEGVSALDEYEPPRGFGKAWGAAVTEAKKVGGTKGTRYEVNINADIADFYDLDKPLNQQPPHLIDAINRVGRKPEFALDRIPDDAKRFDLAPLFKNDAAVEDLKRHGVPGLKYWDQFSRQEGDGTKNLVVFDDKIIDIVSKYGIAGALGAGMISQQMAEQLQSQGYT